MNYAFAGYDLFCDINYPLLENGWNLTNVVITDMSASEPYNSHKKMLEIAKKSGAEITFERIDEAYLRKLEGAGVNVLVSAAYGHKIPVPPGMKLRIINVHPTLLPDGKGPWPLPHIILRKKDKSGVTIHRVSEEFDSGPILDYEEFLVTNVDTLDTLTNKSKQAAIQIFERLTKTFDKKWDTASEQAECGTYWPNFEWDERVIDWQWTIERIDRLIRAFGSFDTGATFNGQDWIVQSAICWKQTHQHLTGSVISETKNEILLAAADGFVLLTSYRADPDNDED